MEKAEIIAIVVVQKWWILSYLIQYALQAPKIESSLYALSANLNEVSLLWVCEVRLR